MGKGNEKNRTFVAIMETVVECKNVSHGYGQLSVLDDINLQIARAEVLSIVGRSGAGKSTLLQILGTLLKPSSGQVLIGGQLISDLGDDELSDFRARNIGFVFQAHHLLQEFSALENVMLAGLIARRAKSEVEADARRLLDLLGLSARVTHKPSQLSGGEQQRVAVARALINRPMVVFADEPTGNLDTTSREELNEMFFSLRDELRQTFVIVTHESDLARMSDRMLTIADGKILL